MRQDRYQQIESTMNSYLRSGAKKYRRKQFNRLINLLDDILAHEPACHRDPLRIGRRQVIGYWRRNEAETTAVRQEKWRVLAYLFDLLGKPEPPKPRS